MGQHVLNLSMPLSLNELELIMPDHSLSRRNVLRSAGVAAAVGVVAGLPAAEAQAQTASKTTQLPTGAVTVVAYVQATGGCEDKLAEISTRLMGEVRANEPGN